MNFYPGDGYFDNEGVNFVHLEAGLTKDYGGTTYGFFQYCYDPNGVNWPPPTWIGWASSTTWYGEFTIENTSMGNYSPEDWRIRYQGSTVASFDDDTSAPNRVGGQFPILAGEALASSERWYTDAESPPSGDDGRSSHVNLKRKNSNGGWLYWKDSVPAADGDNYYRFRKVDGDHSYLVHERY
jgi:hypothetical protein